MNPFSTVGVNIPGKYVFSLPKASLGCTEQRFILAAHISWIREIISENRFPAKFPLHPELSPDEVHAFISQGKSKHLGTGWFFLHLTTVKVTDIPNNYYSFESGNFKSPLGSQEKLTLLQLVDFIGESNFNYLWEQPSVSLLPTEETPEETQRRKDLISTFASTFIEEVHTTEKNFVTKLIQHLYPNTNSVSSPDSGKDDFTSSIGSKDGKLQTSISSLSQALSVLFAQEIHQKFQQAYLGSEKSDSKNIEVYNSYTVFCFHFYVPHTLQECVKFSPQKLNTHLKYLFVAYQILQFIRDCRDNNIPVRDLTLSDFRTDECLYLTAVPSLNKIIRVFEINPEDRTRQVLAKKGPEAHPNVLSVVKSIVHYSRHGGLGESTIGIAGIPAKKEISSLEPATVSLIIKHWCEGLISNYDYLMVLNFLAGRICDGNPNFHPVFPWITDFVQSPGTSCNSQGWRDLSKSKFRLNKGERQLDLMYEDAGGQQSVPHHVTDILSEITYYVYKARITPKEVLCRFVRPKWVPAEYPGSISRMQEWTPDECIPEFYDDPSLFRSIHPDLPDLQVPKWCRSPEDFISKHRQLLESDIVSAKLHHWIDLTFGYKLSGNAAIKSKNVYLALADNHENLEKSGILQLFHMPHPPRRCRLRAQKNRTTYSELRKLRESDPVDDISAPSAESTSTGTSSSDPKSPTRFSASVISSNFSSNNHLTSGHAATSTVWKNITLPKHYDPMGFLNDFEVCLNFFRSHFNEGPESVTLRGLKQKGELSEHMKVFGCLLVELILPGKFSHLPSEITSTKQRFDFYQGYFKKKNVLENGTVPLFSKRALQAIFLPDSLEFAIPVEVSIDLILLGDKISPLPFPSYFPQILKMVRILRNYDSFLLTTDPTDSTLRMKVQELKVKSFSRELLSVLHMLDDDGVDIILPYIIELFNYQETRVLAVWNIFCPISRVLGRKKSADYLLSPVVQIYEADYHSEKHLKLFHRGFLLQLMSCFGLEAFLENFSTLLIEALGGWKAPSDEADSKPRAHLNSTDILDAHNSTRSPEKSIIVSSPTSDNSSLNSKLRTGLMQARTESETGDQNAEAVEPEMFLFEPETSASDCEGDGLQVTGFQLGDSRSPSVSALGDNSSAKSLNISDDVTSDSGPTVGIIRGTCRSISTSSTTANTTDHDISEMCCESIVWLAHRLGPVLTAKYITRNLLRMLTLCYYGHVEPSQNNACEGDDYSNRVLLCLIAISDLYGDSFIERQYLPYASDLIQSSASKRLTASVEAALLGVGALLHKIFYHMTDALLLPTLKNILLETVLTPLVSLICSDSILFPSGASARALLVSKVFGMLNAIRKKIGPDLSILHLKPLLLKICLTFYDVFACNIQTQELKSVFGCSLAYDTYVQFGDLIVGTEFENLIRDLYLKHSIDNNCSPSGGAQIMDRLRPKKRNEYSNSFGSRSFGNRIQIHEMDNGQEPESLSEIPTSRKDTTRHLRGNWLYYWDHEIGRMEKKFDFKQIKLQNFTGHTGAVRSIFVLNNENSFLTASKDKTVKLFALRNQGDETTTVTPQWTYPDHKKSVLSVIFNEPLHLAASTDGFIHIWDPFMGKKVRVLDQKQTKGIICSLKSLENCFVGAGIDSSVHIIDPRSCNSFEMKIGVGQNTGLVRCMCVSPSKHFVSVGHSSGMINSLDLRNGSLLGSWKAHEGEILQLVNYTDNRLVSSSFDQHISVWNMEENRLAFHMRGPTEPVHSISIHNDQLISCTTSNRIGVHSFVDPNSDFSSTRLRSDTFKGIVTTMTLLPLNQILLVGSESGNITLLT